MNDQVVVGNSYLAEAASDLETARSKMVGLRDDMVNDLDKYLATWEGDAKQAYHIALKEWNESLDEMERIVQSLGSAITTIGGNYQHTERSVESQW